MAKFRDPNLTDTNRHNAVDADFAKSIIAAGEDRVALLVAIKGKTKTEVASTLDWICYSTPQNASIALAAAKVADSSKARLAVANFIDMRSGFYHDTLVGEARKILES